LCEKVANNVKIFRINEYSKRMFEIYLDKTKKYRFRLKAKNGENICASQAYSSKSSCMKGIKSVAKNASSKDSFLIHESKTGKWTFKLKSGNNKIIATSQSYADKASMNKGIKSVMTNAPKLKMI
jgi:uncharacterized protein YegP (UPF0339 family)